MPVHRQLLKAMILFLLCALTAACAGQSSAPTVEAAKILAEPTATSRAVSTATAQPSSTATFTPSPTPKPTITPSPTITVDAHATLTWQAYEQAVHPEQTQVAGFPETCGNSYDNPDSVSPGGKWLASSCGYSRNQTLEIVNHKDTRWVLKFEDYLIEEDLKYGTPMGALYPVKWIDDDYLYFSVYVGIDGGGACFYGFGAAGLYRIDLKTGYISSSLPATSPWDGYLFAFSPNGRRLAYRAAYKDPLVIADLRTGENITIEIGNAVSGDFLWSPDGKKLAFATCQTKSDYFDVEKSSVLVYSLETHQTTVLMEVDGKALHVGYREGNDMIEVRGDDRVSDAYFDWDSGHLLPTTPTPSP